ncbi:transmembrane sensor [Pseudoxanthomonas japonensis]|jgi:transmembrane sensor|uniref:FecR family protein n=1 Tax=Pseudoxanthomonas TaxID=83618 RepID=UPI000780C852|nr:MULTISPECIES: FecR domain-containing protein [Pseudoxanthomonas]MDR7068320.1 transmembrane sensor [Pseudoxanthomonas japonensis]
MRDHPRTTRAQALQEASDWLIRLGDHDLQDADIDAWNAWMEASPLHAQAFEDVHLLWDAAAGVDPGQVIAAQQARAADEVATAATTDRVAMSPPAVTHASFQPRPTTAPVPRTATRTRPRRWIALAASVAMLAVLVGALKFSRTTAPTGMRLAAEIGTPRQADLPDGSRIDLDAGSEVVVQFSSQRRQVELVRGQAYFAVAKDAARPFEVRADGALAQALGTHFSVAKRNEGIRVIVTEGRVQVSDLRAHGGGIANHVVQLAANQSATLQEGGPLDGPVDLDAESTLAWLQGKVTYRSETLGNVVADLNRYSRRPIILQDATLAQMRVTGRWSTTDLDVWLDSVAQALSLSVVRRQDEILLVSPVPSTRLPGGKSAASPGAATVRR